MQAYNHLLRALRRSTTITTATTTANAAATNTIVPSFGGWQMLPGSNISRLMAKAGYEWVCVDMEHGNIDDGAMHEAVAALAGCGVSPVVRVADGQGWMIKRALDAGAHGVIVPLLNTVRDAERIVAAAKFPPLGVRGFGSPFPMERFGGVGGGIGMKEYLEQANDGIVVIVQIETEEALGNVDGIAGVQGVDVLFVGPFDLGNSIGEGILEKGGVSEVLRGAMMRVLKAARDKGKKAAIFSTSGEQAREYADMGFDMISVCGDYNAILQANTEALKIAKGTTSLSKESKNSS